MSLRKITKSNKKGQITGIIAFVVILITLILLAPIFMKIVITPTNKIIDSFGNIDPTNKSVEATTFIQTKFTSLFDWVLFAFFMINVILLLVSSFLVDVHPAFLVIYLIGAFVLMMFAPTFMLSADRFWNDPAFIVEDGQNLGNYMPIMKWIFENFGLVTIGVIVLSGLIMFGKYRFGSSGGTGGTY
jgi:hypothetical protein